MVLIISCLDNTTLTQFAPSLSGPAMSDPVFFLVPQCHVLHSQANPNTDSERCVPVYSTYCDALDLSACQYVSTDEQVQQLTIVDLVHELRSIARQNLTVLLLHLRPLFCTCIAQGLPHISPAVINTYPERQSFECSF